MRKGFFPCGAHLCSKIPMALFTDISVLHKHRRTLLAHSGLCTLLAARLVCFQRAAAVRGPLHHAETILLRGLPKPFLLSFYVRVHFFPSTFPPKAPVMLEVTPWDLIDHIIDKVFDLMIRDTDPGPDDSRRFVRLFCKGKTLEWGRTGARVCDCEFVRPHSTLVAQLRLPRGG